MSLVIMPASASACSTNLPTHLPHMKTLIALIIFGWLAVVTFCGPELARAINGPEPVKAKVHRHR